MFRTFNQNDINGFVGVKMMGKIDGVSGMVPVTIKDTMPQKRVVAVYSQNGVQSHRLGQLRGDDFMVVFVEDGVEYTAQGFKPLVPFKQGIRIEFDLSFFEGVNDRITAIENQFKGLCTKLEAEKFFGLSEDKTIPKDKDEKSGIIQKSKRGNIATLEIDGKAARIFVDMVLDQIETYANAIELIVNFGFVTKFQKAADTFIKKINNREKEMK